MLRQVSKRQRDGLVAQRPVVCWPRPTGRHPIASMIWVITIIPWSSTVNPAAAVRGDRQLLIRRLRLRRRASATAAGRGAEGQFLPQRNHAIAVCGGGVDIGVVRELGFNPVGDADSFPVSVELLPLDD